MIRVDLADPGAGLPPSAVALGFFDGYHLGHQIVVAEVMRASGLARAAFTFRNHPRHVLQPGTGPLLLTSFEERVELLEAAGLDYLAWCDFTTELSQISAQAFITEWLGQRMNARMVAAGPNFRFGHRAQGSPETLQAAGLFQVQVVPPVQHDGGVVSSTRIRGLVAEARLDQAARLLSRPFFVTGTVEAGQQVGRQLGAPTANLAVEEWRQYPPHGVYAVRCQGFPGVANLGVRPTFGDHQPRLEVHLLDRQEDLYGRRIRVDFIRHLRPEQRFPSPEALREQIGRDVAQARACLLEG